MPKTLVVSLILLAAAAQYAHAAPAQDDTDRLPEHIGPGQPAERQHPSGHRPTAGDVIRNAMARWACLYRRGGTSAETGFDCSGFVRSMYQQTVGLMLPRTAAEQAAATASIDKTDLRPGDLVFFQHPGDRAYSHVGIYLGGKFIRFAARWFAGSRRK